MFDIMIVGAGTAGLSAAIYAARAGKKVLVLEEKTYGGQIINTQEVENYPGIKKISGYEFATNLYEQAAGLGADIRFEQVMKIESIPDQEGKEVKKVVTNQAEYEGKSVILATGAKNRPLGLDGEQRLIGAGISYCATCDGAFFRGRTVAVNGGGNTALEDAVFLAGICQKVYLIHRRNTFRGEEKQVTLLKEKENVEFLLDSQVTALYGEKKLEAIEVANTVDGSSKRIPVDALFVAIGQMPDNERFSGLVDVDEKGYIKAEEDCHTNVAGIYTAGDCRTKKVRQLATAAADGAVAGLAACEYLEEW
ncbi:MAG: FAD-dependent oxidoreductase [Clostridiales bacterium]|nr:FAD-dependent oxidoreductase [Clostridiales bacterium]